MTQGKAFRGLIRILNSAMLVNTCTSTNKIDTIVLISKGGGVEGGGPFVCV